MDLKHFKTKFAIGLVNNWKLERMVQFCNCCFHRFVNENNTLSFRKLCNCCFHRLTYESNTCFFQIKILFDGFNAFNGRSNAFNGRSNASNGHWAFSTAVYYGPNAVQRMDKKPKTSGWIWTISLKSPSHCRKSPPNRQFSEKLDVNLTISPQNLFFTVTFSGFSW